MKSITIYHNPRCSNSRQALELLKKHGVTPTVIEYLNTPPSTSDIKKLLTLLNITARDLMRRNEDTYQEQKLSDTSLTEDDLIKAIAEHPKLLQRPIIVHGNKAVIARPPENLLEIL